MSKRDCLAKLTNVYGKITIAALDHRGSLKQSLHPDNPESTQDSEILEWKHRMVDLNRNLVAGILIDPIYGKELVEPDSSTGWMLSMEETGYRGDQQARVTTIMPGWSVAKAKAMGACAVKLLLYYDPENIELSKQQRSVAERIAQECIEQDIVFLLEPLSYKVEGSREAEVLKIAEDLKDIKADIFKFEYPGSKDGCEQITAMIKVPWVLLSAGMDYKKYKQALSVAMAAGASGFAVGRAVWQEFGDYQGEDRERYLTNIAKLRMQELVEIVNKSTGAMKTVSEAEVKDKRVIVRVDWNVTLGNPFGDAQGLRALQIVDDTRIVRTLPTIRWLMAHGASRIVLLSHLGKAEEKRSIAPVVDYAKELLGQDIQLFDQIDHPPSEEVIMLENVRLWEGEESNNPQFAAQLARLGDIYVNEAFGECHRSSASIVGISQLLPSYAGLWLMDEVETILKVRDNPARPYVVVMGGSKVEDKIKLIEVLSQSADTIMLGGKLANEYVQNPTSRSALRMGKAKIITPIEGSDLLDIGWDTQKLYAAEIAKAKTVVWNGPMGKVEEEQYRSGTQAIYEALIKNDEAYTLVGGGDTLAAIGKQEHLERIDHVSTGGGAMLKLLEMGSLVGIDALLS